MLNYKIKSTGIGNGGKEIISYRLAILGLIKWEFSLFLGLYNPHQMGLVNNDRLGWKCHTRDLIETQFSLAGDLARSPSPVFDNRARGGDYL